jgi:hypothetical protein
MVDYAKPDVGFAGLVLRKPESDQLQVFGERVLSVQDFRRSGSQPFLFGGGFLSVYTRSGAGGESDQGDYSDQCDSHGISL